MRNLKNVVSLSMGLVVLLSMTFFGCSKQETAAPVAAASDTFDLSVCFASEPQTIDPALNSAVDGAVMLQHFFEGLMKWADGGNPATDKGNMNYAKLVNGQASSYEKTVNADGTVTYTFKIRPDAKWSDGKAVTADDFVFTWQRLASPETAADYCYMIDMVKGYAEVNSGEAEPSTLAVSAPDSSTFQVTITYDCPYFLEVCAFPATFPVRKDVVEADPDTWTTANNSANYISNGPYKLAEWVHDSYIKMVPNEHHYDAANLGPDTITFRLMADQNAMLAGYRSGDLQFIQDMPVDEVAGLLASGELNIVDYIGTYYVVYQTQKAPFDDWRVRKAFTLVIDSPYIVEQITQSGEVPAAGFVPAGIYDADSSGADFRTVGGDYWEIPTTDEIYAKNVAEAKQLLADAGYPNGEGFPVVTYLYNTSDAHKAIGEALQQMWQKELGVTVQLQNQEWNAFLENRKNGEYQIARNGWIADYNDPISFLDMWLTGGGNNDAQYSDAEYDAAIAEAKASADPAVRMAAMHKAEDIIMGRDWALGPIYFYTQKYLMQDIDGAFYTPLGYFVFSYASQN
ncbi:MAG: peptide ABC transporter substrate-binding protein [Spirochaetaceae bacterium]|nr:peptide ABC transporter substrate-binding protein [Spirochaetaceae bacterium]